MTVRLPPDPTDDWTGLMPDPPMPSTTEQLDAMARTYFLNQFLADPSHAGNGATEADIADGALMAWDELDRTAQGKHQKYNLKNALLPLAVSSSGRSYDHLRQHMSETIRDATAALQEQLQHPAAVRAVHTEDALVDLLTSHENPHVVARRLMNLLELK